MVKFIDNSRKQHETEAAEEQYNNNKFLYSHILVRHQ